MIRVTQIKVHPEADKNTLIKKTAKVLGIKDTEIEKLEIVKQSIDARKKPEIYYSYVVDVELIAAKKNQQQKIVNRCKSGQASIASEATYKFPASGAKKLKNRPVIVGMGPAGLFCGYFLAKYGYKPILIERGKDVDSRTADVQRYWETGVLDTASNVQFGEGGAGTFSDGKLNTLVKDKDGRNKEVLKILVEYGAPEKILYDAKPHIGTDVLAVVVKNIREAIIGFGGEVHFETEMLKLVYESAGIKANAVDDKSGETGVKDRDDEYGDISIGSEYADGKSEDLIDTEKPEQRKVSGVLVNEKGTIYKIDCEHVVLAVGHSARNTFETLYKQKVPMEAKSFAVGMRVEHPQSMINESQYGMPDAGVLGAASYKVTAKTSVGRGVYSFCMCPGGYVVNASSEEGCLAVNGMSYSDRGSANANSAIIVAVTPEDFGGEHPLAGVYFQRELEKKAFDLGQGKIPVQRYGVFKSYVERNIREAELSAAEKHAGEAELNEAEKYVSEFELSEAEQFSVEEGFEPCTKGAYRFADVTQILPEECNQAFVEGMEQFGRMIKGFNRPDALLLGVESRTSSPVRIHRDEQLQSEVRGLYPCGEGAGYAGGITSAAMDGVRIAEEFVKQYSNIYA